MLDLTGTWTLSDESGAYSVPMNLPGDGISALHAAGAIADPYWGRNEYDLRWISDRTWVARRRFVTDRTDLVLVASMLDTLVQVAVNGVTVLSSDNMFLCHRVDLSAVLRPGENEIALTFGNVVAEARARQDAYRYKLPYSASNCPIGHGNMLRKPACDFGWDWNIALAPFGVYGDLRLEPIRPCRIASVVVAQDHRPGKATVRVSVTAEGDAEGQEVTVSLCGVFAKARVRRDRAEVGLPIEDPVLWWPAGQGAQVLHEMQVRLGEETQTRRIGLRAAELVTTPEPDGGLGFKFRVNGRDIFAKGANWIPADALAGRITRAAVRDLFQSAVDANMNMLRVWGGGRYEPDWFYDLADEMGLMIWQDFMFACHIYPADDVFLTQVAEEVRQNALRLHHHPAIVLWCGDNELIGALTWFPETRANRDQYLVGYDRLNRTIELALKGAVPGAVWWPSSPSPGPMDFGDTWHDDRKGDMHFWSVWHEGRDFDHYRDVSPRFCSEFGFQSYPSMDVVRRFASPSDFNIAAPVMESHQKNHGGNARIAETMFRYFRFPVDFENFVYLSQVQQGLAIKTAVTHWRSLKPHCMGTLYWQLNDTWPVCSWASLDHGGGWKLLHHMARHFFAPVTVMAVPQDDRILLRAVNDLPEPVELTVTARAVAMSGAVRDIGTATETIGTSAMPVLSLPRSALAADEILVFTWTSPDGTSGGDHFAPLPYKAYDLPRPDLSLAVEGNVLTLATQGLALFVAVEADQPGRFSDNGFALFPGHPARITFTPADPGGPWPRFTLRDLHSATYGA